MLDHAEADDELLEGSFVQARLFVRLNLPEVDTDSLDDAKEASQLVVRDTVKWKRRRCRSVKVLSETEFRTVFMLEVDHAVEFDWTWEERWRFERSC